ncbi:MAG: N-formylglutamate deformylase [Rickettsiales bacterium]
MNPVEVTQPNCPVVLAMPHSGTYVPPEIADKLNETGKLLADTDWHIDRLYDGLLPEAGIVKANFHRYVIDANRSPEGGSLYPGQNTTTLCPLTDFDGKPIWKEGMAPDDAEIKNRTEHFHAPYHDALRTMLESVKAQYGYALLYDCHSIRSEAPFLFEGVLPTLNIGTNDGKSCAPVFEKVTAACCEKSAFSTVVNGRFKGGWTTRHYGQPVNNIHAVQMEIAQSAYMVEEAPWNYVSERAENLRALLGSLLSELKNTKA